jgi:hypothetical protein
VQAPPTREAPHCPVDTSQFELAQSTSAVHLGRQMLPAVPVDRQRCSARQLTPDAQLFRHSELVAPTWTHCERAGHPPGLQLRVQ